MRGWLRLSERAPMEEGPVLHEGSVQLSGEGTLDARATLYKRVFGPLGSGVAFGLIGTLGALISTIWFTPEFSYDAWWARISGGLGPGSLFGSFLLWSTGWKVELTIRDGRWWNPFNLRLCLRR